MIRQTDLDRMSLEEIQAFRKKFRLKFKEEVREPYLDTIRHMLESEFPGVFILDSADELAMTLVITNADGTRSDNIIELTGEYKSTIPNAPSELVDIKFKTRFYNCDVLFSRGNVDLARYIEAVYYMLTEHGFRKKLFETWKRYSQAYNKFEDAREIIIRTIQEKEKI